MDSCYNEGKRNATSFLLNCFSGIRKMDDNFKHKSIKKRKLIYPLSYGAKINFCSLFINLTNFCLQFFSLFPENVIMKAVLLNIKNVG